MKIAVISDLHIGDNRFEQHADQFPAFLDFLERHYDSIILLGDIFETAFPPWPWQAGREYLRIFKHYKKITRRFCKDPYVLMSGNHDAIGLRRYGIAASLELKTDGMRILFTHGHELEKQYQAAWLFRLTELYLWGAGFLRRLGLDWLYRLAYFFDHHQNVADGGQRYISGARNYIKKYNYDCVVMGHTHQELLLQFDDGGVYLNSGDCQSRCIFASIDTRRKVYNIQEFFFDGGTKTLEQLKN